MRYNIADFVNGDSVNEFFVIKAADVKTGKTGKHYLAVDLSDATGIVSGKKWDLYPNERDFVYGLKAGDIVKISGKVTEFAGTPQLNIEAIRAVSSEEPIERSELYKTAPEPSEDMYQWIIGRINAFEDEDLKKLCLSFYEDNREKLMYYPAAMRNHHAEYGGLLYHVKRMMMMGERACEVYTNLSKDLVLAGVALHDIEKLNEILSDENGMSPGYTTKGQLLGHLTMGAIVIDGRCRELGIPEEKALMLEHMSISHHYEPDFGSPKKPLFPEAELLHYLDMMDAKMFDFEDTLSNVKPGEFSDKVFQLDNRKLYKRTF
ncbi:MAG: CMP-binding protein [Clostridiales bacterium]|nr:CMP-binding protein [Candidatus Crickella merdequi]